MGDCGGKGLPTDPMGFEAGEGAVKVPPAPAVAGLGCWGEGCGILAGLGWRTEDGGLCRSCWCCWCCPEEA